MWGTGASSTQCEGAAPASDWLAWENAGRAPRSGTETGSRIAMRRTSRCSHRLVSHTTASPSSGHGSNPNRASTTRPPSSTTWRCSRRPATPGVEPWVCLHHFTLPRWFAESGGFLVESNRTDVWARHVDFIAETFGELVAGWKPVNETNYYARSPTGPADGHPASTTLSRRRWWTKRSTSPPPRQRSRSAGPVRPVASIYRAVRDRHARRRRRLTAQSRPRVRRQLGARDRSVPRRHPEGRRSPASRAARSRRRLRLVRVLVLRIDGCCRRTDRLPPTRCTPISRSATPSGPTVSAWCSTASTPTFPAHRCWWASTGSAPPTTSNGPPTWHEASRSFGRAMDRGVDVRGLFHWTGIDNYEWLHGFDVQFGIIDRHRSVRSSATVLQREHSSSTDDAANPLVGRRMCPRRATPARWRGELIGGPRVPSVVDTQVRVALQSGSTYCTKRTRDRLPRRRRHRRLCLGTDAG